MTIARLEYFVAVAEELSFTRAAARLRMTQPPLTQQIRQLEREIGQTLLIRSTRHVELTAAGVAVLAEARRVLAHFHRLPQTASRAARSERRPLRVGCVTSGIVGLVPQLLPRFAEQEPSIPVEVRELAVEDQLPMLRSGELDVGIFRSVTPPDHDVAFDLADEDWCVIVKSDHPLAELSEVPWTSVRDENIIMASRQVAPLEVDSVLQACELNGFTPTTLSGMVLGYNAIALVASGMGVTIVPQRVASLLFVGATARRLVPAVKVARMRMLVRQSRFGDPELSFARIAESIPPGTVFGPS